MCEHKGVCERKTARTENNHDKYTEQIIFPGIFFFYSANLPNDLYSYKSFETK